MRILIISDIEDRTWKLGNFGKVDCLISCGDIDDKVISEAAIIHNTDIIMAVKGNHDLPTPFPPEVTDLHLKTTTVNNVTFGGFNGSYKYKPRGHFLYTQNEAADLLNKLPGADVMVCHNSPSGIHERDKDIHQGFIGINKYIERHRPLIIIHGHQHINSETMVQNTRVLGVHGAMAIVV